MASLCDFYADFTPLYVNFVVATWLVTWVHVDNRVETAAIINHMVCINHKVLGTVSD